MTSHELLHLGSCGDGGGSRSSSFLRALNSSSDSHIVSGEAEREEGEKLLCPPHAPAEATNETNNADTNTDGEALPNTAKRRRTVIARGENRNASSMP